MKRMSLNIGRATGFPWDHQLQVLPPPLAVLGDWHQYRQMEEVVVVLAVVEQVVETKA